VLPFQFENAKDSKKMTGFGGKIQREKQNKNII